VWLVLVVPLVVLLPVLITAAVTLGVALGTIWQKNRTDTREAWWKRTQWAMEAASAPGAENELRRTMGLTVLSALADEKAATAVDQAMMLAIADKLLEAAPQRRELDFWDSVLKEVDEGE
jgi:Flp pilus assembly pilin Flp